MITVLSDATYQQSRFGILKEQRMNENGQALFWLQASDEWRLLNFSDENPDWKQVEDHLFMLDAAHLPEIVLAPMYEVGGHCQHNALALAAIEVFGGRCRGYATYKRGHTRTQTDFEVPHEPEWPAKKLRAMACFASQINLANTRPWFSNWDREFMA